MARNIEHQRHHSFLLRILLPTALAIGLFVISLFVIIIPSFEQNILSRKREMIRELTAAAWSILDELHTEQTSGVCTREAAMSRAIARIRTLRYGRDGKDYFWITDMTPRMVVHPYRSDLEGKDLTDFQDPRGKKLFVAFVDTVRAAGDGYVEYQWQWKDDATRVVPKLSYVREFKPWGWIIGTGVYIEDVREEIETMTDRVVQLSVVITAIILVLLLYIFQQSLRVERQRRGAEAQLLESKDKYQALVEAATEGIIMVTPGSVTRLANRTMLDMLGCTESEFQDLTLEDIFLPMADSNEVTAERIKSLSAGQPVLGQFEARLKRVNGQTTDILLATSQITFADKQGYVIATRDITRHKEIEEKLDVSEQQYRALTNAINIGVFRTTMGKKWKFIEGNRAAMRILGFEETEQFLTANLADFLHDRDDRENFHRQLTSNGWVKNQILRLRKKDGTVPTVSVSAVLTIDPDGREPLCDAIIEDITEQKKAEQEREGLIVELQTALLFLNQPVRNSTSEPLFCDMSTPISQVASIMSKNNVSAVLVRSNDRNTLGIVTDRDLRDRVVASEQSLISPVFEIMSSPIITIPDRALLFEAALLMQEKSISHLVVRNANDMVTGIVSYRDVLQVQRYSSAFLLREIHQALSVEEITDAHARLPRLVKALMDSGANSRNIVRLIASVSDAISKRLIQLAVDRMGTPPAEFAFLALGSAGRLEQTMKTDQDNAIIYDDSACEDPAAANDYFVRLGTRVCDDLCTAGYAKCEGETMASNPRWCQSITQWRKYFRDWIVEADPNDLLAVSILFDFRCVYGKCELADELRLHVHSTAAGKAGFFHHLTLNALQYKPPIGFFGNIVVGTDEGQAETFDIKKAMMPVIEFARIYTLRTGVTKTNTLDRLQQIRDKKLLNQSEHEEIAKAYDFLMTLRIKHQTQQVSDGEQPDNFINPKELAQIELLSLKKTLSQVSDFQSKLKVEFTGTSQ